jgi:hypothetical protein
MTYEQRTTIPAALEVATEFAAANGLTTNLTTYMEVREMANGSGHYGVFLFTTDREGYEVTVRVEIAADGAMSGARGLDAKNAWAYA